MFNSHCWSWTGRKEKDNRCLWTVVLEKMMRVPRTAKTTQIVEDIQPVMTLEAKIRPLSSSPPLFERLP